MQKKTGYRYILIREVQTIFEMNSRRSSAHCGKSISISISHATFHLLRACGKFGIKTNSRWRLRRSHLHLDFKRPAVALNLCWLAHKKAGRMRIWERAAPAGGWRRLLACRQAMLICHCHVPDLQEDPLHLHQVVRWSTNFSSKTQFYFTPQNPSDTDHLISTPTRTTSHVVKVRRPSK